MGYFILRYESSKSLEKIRALWSPIRFAFKCLGCRGKRKGECGLHWNGEAFPGVDSRVSQTTGGEDRGGL